VSSSDETMRTDESSSTSGGQAEPADGSEAEGQPRRALARRPSVNMGTGRLVRRYGPILAVAVLAVGALVVFGSGGGDDDDTEGTVPEAVQDRDELVRSGPMTPERARLENASVNFGPKCDVNLGRINLPTVYAPPCVVPFEGDNGGATSAGVTAEAIKVVVYSQELGALTESVVEGTGAELDEEQVRETVDRYVTLYNQVYETYGRRVEVEYFPASGAMGDEAAARADAIAIAEREPFAVIGGPSQASAIFADELASRGIVCLEQCAVGLTDDFLDDHAPYVWQGSPSTWLRLTAEAVGKLAGPGNAEMAGDPELRDQERVYAVVDYETPDGTGAGQYEAFRGMLEDDGIEVTTHVPFTLDLTRAQETARTVIAQLEEAGVTTVIITPDPLTPASLTEEATAQDYFPEWILGNNYLADTEQFARTYDQQQWGNGFAVTVADAAAEGLDSFDQVYRWAYDTAPPSDSAGLMEPPLRALFTGIHLAGSTLTAETFRDGLYRYPPTGGGPTRPTMSWGDPAAGDVTLMWWDTDAEGVDETGAEGQGMYRFANGGQRYGPGEIPDTPEQAGLFDEDSSVIEYDELPAEDQPPTYPPPG
jgi:hypothetical protein